MLDSAHLVGRLDSVQLVSRQDSAQLVGILDSAGLVSRQGSARLVSRLDSAQLTVQLSILVQLKRWLAQARGSAAEVALVMPGLRHWSGCSHLARSGSVQHPGQWQWL